MSMAAGAVFGSESQRYADPATELEVVRLTNPGFASGLTAPHLRQFTKRGDGLVYWSERDGSKQIYRLDFKTGESKQLTGAESLDVRTFGLSPDERFLYYFDGPVLRSVASGSTRARDIYKMPEGSACAGLSIAVDGSLLLIEQSRIIRLALQKTHAIVEVKDKIDLVMARPRHAQLLYGQDGAFWLTNIEGGVRKKLALMPGATGEALWSPNGHTLLYLHDPDDPKQLVTLRENGPDDSSDRLIARTSQYSAFAPNADSSVFAAASRSRASAYIVILLRVARQELTLCEHRASDPSLVQVIFTPNSQSIIFVSDRDGKTALYRVPVEKFVEETGDQ